MGQNILPIYAALVVTSLSIGFWAGTHTKARTDENTTENTVVPSPQSHAEKRLRVEELSDGNETDETEEESSVSSLGDGDIESLKMDPIEDTCKMVLVVRTDLGMTSGKIAAQCSHAALACYKTLLVKNPVLLRQWERTGQTKVALRCDNEDEMLLLKAQAQSLNLCARSIQDAGRTQIAAGSRTVLGIAGPARLVNQITGKLKLL